jgi:hypothetical protein
MDRYSTTSAGVSVNRDAKLEFILTMLLRNEDLDLFSLRPLSCTQSITYLFTIKSTSPAAAMPAALNFTASPALAQTGTPTATSGQKYLILSNNFTTSPTAPYRTLLFQDALATPL